MKDSVSDLIYLLAFGLLMFLINRKKKKNKEPVEEKNQSSESQIKEEDVNALEVKIEHNVSSSSQYRQRKTIFKDEKDFLAESKPQKHSESHLALLHDIAATKQLPALEPDAKKEKEQNVINKTSTQDMVVLSAIYFTPYI